MQTIQAYLVGGAVRDQLLGLPQKDRDWVVTGATPDTLIQAGFKPVGNDFPVFLHPVTGEEYALARTERKTAKGYHGFQFHTSPEVTLEQDLARRDLTINAMAMDEQGKLIDPYGGLQDLQAKRLRHVSPAFAEDPVRILRVARFAARFAPLGFSVAEDTLQLMSSMVKAGEVNALVPERVWQEMVKALSEPVPEAFIRVLRACQALAIILPELERLFGIPQQPEHHPEIDCGEHTLLVLHQAVQLSLLPEVRFAALMHDVGKGLTPTTQWPKHTGHESVSARLVRQVSEHLRVPTRFRDLAEQVATYHGAIHKGLRLSVQEIINVLEQTDAFRKPDRFALILIACEADSRGRLGFEQAPYPQRAFWQQCLAACSQVNVQAIIQQGFQGEAIKHELRQRRLQVLTSTFPSIQTMN